MIRSGRIHVVLSSCNSHKCENVPAKREDDNRYDAPASYGGTADSISEEGDEDNQPASASSDGGDLGSDIDDYDDAAGFAFQNDDDDDDDDDALHNMLFKGRRKPTFRPKPYDAKFNVYRPLDIARIVEKELNMLKESLALPPDVCRPLLHNSNWSLEKVYEVYPDQGEKSKELLKKAGLGELLDLSSAASSLQVNKQPWPQGFSCAICGDDEPSTPNVKVLSLVGCRHQFCEDCYKEYIGRKVAEREIQFGCPGCKLVLPDSAIQTIAPDVFAKFKEWQIRSYVDARRNFRFCLAPDCTMVIQFNGMNGLIQDPLLQMPKVTCSCGYSFCFLCDHETDHQPLCCELLRKWIKRCKDDTETAKWISANTKDCLKCKTAIEKNGGCHRMVSSLCSSVVLIERLHLNDHNRK
ncbi:hypothetical protein SeLEV6574_g08163 [Synchytrium endobioticum]|uniref:RBR-type E3 ubiquitin transferase n=1 Tax=Synchytrium endobioticum TaxID=286115 RepID=A0A507C283_9FUNG|nr:hypothetical protein SeLEV6574_g08163 [Synchytrium endobioticum]